LAHKSRRFLCACKGLRPFHEVVVKVNSRSQRQLPDVETLIASIGAIICASQADYCHHAYRGSPVRFPSRIEEAGYTEVSGLKLDDQDIWRAMGTKDGEHGTVALDFQGNITMAQ